jgi:DnaJ-class molecular chaperone
MGTKSCPDCNGDGVVDEGTDDEHQCPTCGGSGFVPDDDNDDQEILNTSRTLSRCLEGVLAV